jgi:hypothetical protein
MAKQRDRFGHAPAMITQARNRLRLLAYVAYVDDGRTARRAMMSFVAKEDPRQQQIGQRALRAAPRCGCRPWIACRKRDKVNLDIFWLNDKSLEDSDDLPDPDILAQEIADDLETALEQFTAIATKLKK